MVARRVGVAMAGGNPVEGKQQDDGFYDLQALNPASLSIKLNLSLRIFTLRHR